jgi:transcriptional regulator with XRE-family HTH domain
MTFRLDDIGKRLKAFRMASGMSADEVAQRLDISRTALYRFEEGAVTKIETLEKLADLLDVSVPTLLGVGVEYIASAVAYFERIRQIEETAEHIVVLAGPISYLLASDAFDATLGDLLRESVPAKAADRARALADIEQILDILGKRKETYRARRPGMVNLISAAEIERFLRAGLVGRSDLAPAVLKERRKLARAEVAHFAEVVEAQPMGIQIGIVPDTLPHTGFQIFRQPDRQILTISPFRLGEQPNVRVGVALITPAPEAVKLHQKAVEDMWQRAMRGAEATKYLRNVLARDA